MYWFYLDPLRPLPEGSKAILVKSYNAMIRYIDLCVEYDVPFAISFCHDLKERYRNGTGIAEYIVKKEIPMKAFHIHGIKSSGADEIRKILLSHGYHEAGATTWNL